MILEWWPALANQDSDVLLVCCVEHWTAVQEEDHLQAKRLYENLLGVWNAIDRPNLPANEKASLKLQVRDAGFPIAPMPQSSPDHEVEILHAPATMRHVGGCVRRPLCGESRI
jgi:dihydrodipicolinate synthase/N-acetylneuraminate lyase